MEDKKVISLINKKIKMLEEAFYGEVMLDSKDTNRTSYALIEMLQLKIEILEQSNQ